MQKSKQLCLLVCLGLMFLMTQTLWGQFVVKVNATDGSGITDTLTLAVNPAGTAGFDSLSPSFREFEIPVHAFGLDFRVATNPPDDNLGLGAYTSIHKLNLVTQTDKWKLQFNIDSGRTGLLVQWPAGLGSVGGGYWILRANPSDPISFSDVDMTSGPTSFTIPLSDQDQHSFYIVTGDGQEYRSFTSTEIAQAHDSKLKTGKSEKRKPYASEGNFTFTNDLTPLDTVTDIHIEWSQGITQPSFSISPAGTQTWDPKFAKLDYVFASPLLPGASVTIFAQGNKGKPLQAKKWWWTKGGLMEPPKTKFGPKDPSSGSRLLLYMPNINNLGEEMYTQGVLGANGIAVGDPVNAAGTDIKGKPIIRAVIHPKWKDVTKTLMGKNGNLQDQAADCLTKFIGSGKDIVKTQKSLPPEKHDNILLGDAVALRVNIGFGDAGKIEEGGTVFGDLHYVRQSGDPPLVPVGATLRRIADSLDNVLLCHHSTWDTAATNYAMWDAMIARINASFSGVFDTTSFGGPIIGGPQPKPVGTQAKGVKPIVEVPYLYRTSLTAMSPYINPPDIATLEARNQPKEYALAQNYPNPFNPTTTIEFALSEDAFVTLKIYNMLGQEVATLVDNEMMDEGPNEVTFDAAQFASGVYYYRMIVNDGQFQQIKKMVLVK